ncbi:hypothetical protein M0802_015500 [Mischocyttarus mexicanus]|nr:hypothetical protein M0802_015500 [Mischocyttarus mexicanus]
MNILRLIILKTSKDHIRTVNIKHECNIQDIVKRVRRRNRDEHISRIDAYRMVKEARYNRSKGIRPPGRP